MFLGEILFDVMWLKNILIYISIIVWHMQIKSNSLIIYFHYSFLLLFINMYKYVIMNVYYYLLFSHLLHSILLYINTCMYINIYWLIDWLHYITAGPSVVELAGQAWSSEFGQEKQQRIQAPGRLKFNYSQGVNFICNLQRFNFVVNFNLIANFTSMYITLHSQCKFQY